MAVIINSYTKTVTHDKKKLAITVNVYDEPCLKNEMNDFYTHIHITHLDNKWGEGFTPNAIEDDLIELFMQDVKNNIAKYQTV